ncbi:rna-directed dna polymerase from mobile element jockey-like [Willisornis vidua]|uniref:Rna-directed dna polymerase from mobile element jockey-like n=1 Tax=Willisornis vidua TaxID=1566151 RepID=A0ABQ9DIS5_9PASS|nr:rna-directed dna polymerase from mobile element jockey-like [Willisornis vidua]
MLLSGRHWGQHCLVSFLVTDSIIECNLSKFADNTKLCGVINMVEEKAAMQRDLDRHETWPCENIMKFNKAKCKVQHLGQDNPRHKYRLGRQWIEGCPGDLAL